ncbi:helix-turn-helix domain-containing protein [Streptacidiphilus sp. 4-A2]|nr:helix-turn-helix domain-containing protein [Streptacidiphilus sp. 4-A2]
MALRVEMADEVRAWLNGLVADGLPAARLVGEAVTALFDEGGGLEPPLVVAVEPMLRAQDPRRALDHTYQSQLGLLQQIRRGVADVATSRKRLELQLEQLGQQCRTLAEQGRKAAGLGRNDLAQEALARRSAMSAEVTRVTAAYETLRGEEDKLTAAGQRMQQQVDSFRSRKETAKAVYTAGLAQAAISEACAALDGPEVPGPDTDDPVTTARAHAEDVLGSAHAREQELRQLKQELGGTVEWDPGRQEADLLELRPGSPAEEGIRILFAVSPAPAADTVVLLAAAVRPGNWFTWYDEVLPQARSLLFARAAVVAAEAAGEAPSPPFGAAFASYRKESFLDAFFPGRAEELESGAARLVARNRMRPLSQVRRQSGLTETQLAARMQVSPETVVAIERAESGATELRTLAAYVEALGGRLDVVADLGGERFLLSRPNPGE